MCFLHVDADLYSSAGTVLATWAEDALPAP